MLQTCIDCGIVKDSDQFGKYKTLNRRTMNFCKQCFVIRVRDWNKMNTVFDNASDNAMCECGSIVRMMGIARHRRTSIHCNYLERLFEIAQIEFSTMQSDIDSRTGLINANERFLAEQRLDTRERYRAAILKPPRRNWWLHEYASYE
jgi:hypothetical protein